MNVFESEWFSGLKPEVQEVVRRYPPGTELLVDGQIQWVVSYPQTESGEIGLFVSQINPFFDYETAQAHKHYICPDHI